MIVFQCRRAVSWLSLLSIVVCGLIAAAPSNAPAADWFVAPVPVSGDGSRDKPFHDPWRALAVAAPGDAIHVAEGTYHGRYDRSAWEVDRPRITILGGYDTAFARRDPWQQPSIFAFNRDYEGIYEDNLFNGRGDHAGLVLDGVVFDGGGRNKYDPKAPMGLRGGLKMVGPLVSLASPDVTIRNCVLINSTTGAVEMRGEGSRFENNIVLNHHGQAMLAIRETGSGGGKRPMVIRGNTFAFAHDDTDPPMGRGGDKGVAIRCATTAQITGNAFIACGNAAIQVYTKAQDVSIDRNLFALSPRAAVALREGSRESVITEKNLEEMEDLSFKSCQANRATGDLELTGLKGAWIDGVTRQIWLSYAKPPKDGLTKLRAKYRLGEVAKSGSGDDLGLVAPYVDPRDACALRVGDAAAGARPVELKVEFKGDAGRTVVASDADYPRVEWAEFNAGPRSLDGQRVAIVAALGHERNGFVLQGMTNERLLGFDVYYPGGDRGPDQIHVYASRNGAAHRQWEDATKSTGARDAEDWYLLRGVCRLTGARQKATLEVESIVPAEGPEKKAPVRPKGRDWYVRAGATGSDGTKEKPFRDPFQALEKAQPGDAIHVAGGDYFGKLRAGTWGIGARQLTLLGGYDAEFKARDPWRTPTRLVAKTLENGEKLASDKPKHDGTFLKSTDNCDGLILDGFVFDGSTANAYYDAASGGGLNLGASPIGIMVQLGGLGLTVRNCVFVNASGIAVELSAPFGTFEDNVIVNTSGTALIINAMGPGPWNVRHNTLLFAMDPTARAGTGMSTAMGSILLLRGRCAAKVEANILAFADNYAIRATTPRDKLRLDRNVLDANLYCHLTDAKLVWLHDSGWERRLADAAFPSARDNTLVLPSGLPIDPEYADKVLPRFFEKKGRYKRDDLARVARAIGATVTPPAETDATATAAPVEEKSKAPKKEQSLDELMAELDKMKKDREKKSSDGPAVAAPKGPPYCPVYPWKRALELAREPSAGTAGARREKVD